MREQGIEAVGITNEETEWKSSNAHVVLGDMHDTPFKNKEFDAVWSRETLEHSPAPYILLRELARVTKDDGEFAHFISLGMEKQRETYHFSCFPDWLWYDLFNKSGWTVDKIYDGHDSEYGFIGRRNVEPFCDGRWSYPLRESLNAVTREKIVL